MSSPGVSKQNFKVNRKFRELLNALRSSLTNLENVRMASPNDPDLEHLKAGIRAKIAEIESHQQR
jgi:hypothetical protein